MFIVVGGDLEMPYTELSSHTTACNHHCIICILLHTSVITQDGYSALMKAAYMGQTEVVVELAKAGADLNLQNNVCQHFACVMNNFLRASINCRYTLDFSRVHIIKIACLK